MGCPCREVMSSSALAAQKRRTYADRHSSENASLKDALIVLRRGGAASWWVDFRRSQFGSGLSACVGVPSFLHTMNPASTQVGWLLSSSESETTHAPGFAPWRIFRAFSGVATYTWRDQSFPAGDTYESASQL